MVTAMHNLPIGPTPRTSLALSSDDVFQLSSASAGSSRERMRSSVAILICAVALAAVALAACASSALAGGLASPYGEVAHFGGYGDTSGKFVVPTGFAVEPENPSTHEQNAVYVLDQTLSEPKGSPDGELDYRLQKLSSSGTVLGSTTISEKYTDERHYTDAHPLVSLTVDAAQKRVYAVVEGIVDSGEGDYVAVAQELVAWSTTPNAGKLEAAEGTYTPDPITKAALITDSLEKSSASEDLFAPEGLAIASNHDVVIEAQHGVNEAVGGPTILQSFSTADTNPGQLESEWIAPYGEQAGGIFPTTEGSTHGFGIDLYQRWGAISRLVNVNEDFASEAPIAPDTSGGANLDEAPSIDNLSTPNGNTNEGGATGRGTLGIYTAASPITQVDGGPDKELYAARYAQQLQGQLSQDFQSKDAFWESAAPMMFWTQGDSETAYVANVGIRLFNQAGQIVTTLGGQAQGHECNLDFAQLSLAAGAEGALFVLTQPNTENNNEGDEVIEFAPGGKGACQAPSGQIEVNGQEVKPEAGEAVAKTTVFQDAPVKFSAISIDRAGEAPYSFEWNFTGASTGGKEGYTFSTEMTSPGYLWSSPEAEHTYTETTEPGKYDEASVRVDGDYGTSVFPVDIKVVGTAAPVAKFTTPATIVAGHEVVFEAAESKATPGYKIENYQWEFVGESGSKTQKNTATSRLPYTFASPGKYKVKLTITDEAKHTSVPAEGEVTVATPEVPSNGGSTGSTGGGSQPGNTSSGGGTGAAVQTGNGPKPTKQTLTNEQKLANALKACKKEPKKRRASCEKQAHKQYGKKPKKKAKKKKH
jgi:hypothetical protein